MPERPRRSMPVSKRPSGSVPEPRRSSSVPPPGAGASAWADAVALKLERVPNLEGEARAALLEEIASLQLERLGDSAAAAESLVSAIEAAPSRRQAIARLQALAVDAPVEAARVWLERA